MVTIKFNNLQRLLLFFALLISTYFLYSYFFHVNYSFNELDIPINLLSEPHNLLYDNCTHHTCFNVHLCANDFASIQPNRLRVFVYPETLFVNKNLTTIGYNGVKLFKESLAAINNTKYAVLNPESACVYVYSLNFEGENKILPNTLLKLLLSFPWMGNKRNHLLFSLNNEINFNERFEVQRFPGIIAASGLTTSVYRSMYDISLPTINLKHFQAINLRKKDHILAFVQSSFSASTCIAIKRLLMKRLTFAHISLPSSVVTNLCDHLTRNSYGSCFQSYTFNENQPILLSTSNDNILAASVFCVVDQSQIPHSTLFNILRSGCIPVILDSNIVLPFAEKLDWNKCSLRIQQSHVENLLDIIASLSLHEVNSLQQHATFFYDRYFSSISTIITTALDIINDRAFPQLSKSFQEWNNPEFIKDNMNSNFKIHPGSPSICKGYSVIVLVERHFQYIASLLSRLDESALIREIFLIWINPDNEASSKSFLPLFSKPIIVLPPLYNHRYATLNSLPDTESTGFLVIDEESVLPEIKQLDFAFEVWCQHPTRVISPGKSSDGKRTTDSSFEDTNFVNGPVFFHKFYLSFVMDHLGGQFNSLLSSLQYSCVELLLPALAEHLSRKSVILVKSESSLVTVASSQRARNNPFSSINKRRLKCLSSVTIRDLFRGGKKTMKTFSMNKANSAFKFIAQPYKLEL